MAVCYGVARWSYVEIRFTPQEVWWCPGISRRSFTPQCVPEKPGCLKKLKSPGPLPGECRFNTVYPDFLWCLPASLQFSHGGPLCPHRSVTGTENRDSVNKVLRSNVRIELKNHLVIGIGGFNNKPSTNVNINKMECRMEKLHLCHFKCVHHLEGNGQIYIRQHYVCTDSYFVLNRWTLKKLCINVNHTVKWNFSS